MTAISRPARRRRASDEKSVWTASARAWPISATASWRSTETNHSAVEQLA